MKLFNPFWKLKGFDGEKDTPEELLHVYLLGVAKSLFKDFMNSCKKGHSNFEKCWESVNPNSLHLDPICPNFKMAHYGILLGKIIVCFFKPLNLCCSPSWMNIKEKFGLIRFSLVKWSFKRIYCWKKNLVTAVEGK